MKKFLTLGIVALVLIALSGCQFNIFAAFDRIEIPSVADLNAKAGSDPDGFVDDVEDYVENDFLENEDVTDAQVDAIVANLETIYLAPPDIETGQKAAVLAGDIIINSDPDTSFVIGNIVSSISDALESGSTDPEALVAGIFPPDMSLIEFSAMLVNIGNAASAYEAFAQSIDNAPADGTVDGTADWMTSGEVGDVVLYGLISIVITDLTAAATNPPDDLYDFIYNPAVTTIPGYDSGTEDPFANSNELMALLDLSGLGL